jgi:hypothetical protein
MKYKILQKMGKWKGSFFRCYRLFAIAVFYCGIQLPINSCKSSNAQLQAFELDTKIEHDSETGITRITCAENGQTSTVCIKSTIFERYVNRDRPNVCEGVDLDLRINCPEPNDKSSTVLLRELFSSEYFFGIEKLSF